MEQATEGKTEGKTEGAGGKKACPSRGTRYSYAVKKEILKYAEENSVEAAAEKFGVTDQHLRVASRR